MAMTRYVCRSATLSQLASLYLPLLMGTLSDNSLGGSGVSRTTRTSACANWRMCRLAHTGASFSAEWGMPAVRHRSPRCATHARAP